jgi:hypothetical protein
LLSSFTNETGAILSKIILPSRQNNDDLPGLPLETAAGEYKFIEFPIKLVPCDPSLVDEWIKHQIASDDEGDRSAPPTE